MERRVTEAFSKSQKRVQLTFNYYFTCQGFVSNYLCDLY